MRLDPVEGHEQAGTRPAVVVSDDRFNAVSGVVVVLPFTRTHRGYPSRIEVRPPEGGLASVSYVIGEQPRAVSTRRFGRRAGRLRPATMAAVEDVLRLILAL